MRRLLVLAALLPLTILGCGGMGDPDHPAPTPEQGATVEPGAIVEPDLTPAETPRETAERFLTLWREQRFHEMYDFLDSDSQATVDRDQFVRRYRDIAEEARITGIDFEIPPTVLQEATEVPFTVTIHTSFFDDIIQDNTISLRQEMAPTTGGAASNDRDREHPFEWRLSWSPSLIFKELDDHTLVHFFPLIPRRGAIFDRKGRQLALEATVPVIGIVPERISEPERLITELSQALALSPEEVRAQVESDVPEYFFVPVKTLPFGTSQEELQRFYDMVSMGVLVREGTRRIYPFGNSLAHVIGYMGEVNAEQLEDLQTLGFRPGDRIGVLGLEATMEEDLRGERGAILATINREGAIAFTIARKDEKPGTNLHLTIDIDLQIASEAVLGERVGSLVAINPQDNSILAMASYPRFDPNDFITGLTGAQFAALQENPHQPFLHRATLATYPPGSTFKVVTMTAGLEEGEFSPNSTIPCTPTWDGLGPNNPARANWQEIDRGLLTPAEGLMASCNPIFYEMALALDNIDEEILPKYAREFGLGSFTEVDGLDEAPGIVPGPIWKLETLGETWFSGDTVNMGIGQGFVLATPLQIVNMYSALANDAVLRSPLLVAKKGSNDGTIVQEFRAQEIHPLPMSQTTLEAIREGLALVIHDPGGTSYQPFLDSTVDAAGKSGTAEDLPFGSDHVFFVAYANRSDPSIVAIAALEEGESGSIEAAPMVRQILETYIVGPATEDKPDLILN